MAEKLGNESMSVQVSANDWDSQEAGFQKAVDAFGRIDYVFPIAGIGERKAIKNDPKSQTGFEKPDLAVIDVDLTGVLYTAFLAIQQMRRQEKDSSGIRGRSTYRLANPPRERATLIVRIHSCRNRVSMRLLLRSK